MGWAKYYEDNNELIDERLSLSKSLPIDISIVCSPVVTLPRKDGDVKTDQPRTETFSDKTIICITCGRPFVFSAKSQRIFKEKGWKDPKRCKCCREHKNIVCLMHASF